MDPVHPGTVPTAPDEKRRVEMGLPSCARAERLGLEVLSLIGARRSYAGSIQHRVAGWR